MKIDNNINFSEVSTIKQNTKDAKDGKEIFKKLFVEQMVKEMLKTASYEEKDNDLQKDLMNDQFIEAMSDQLMDFSDIEWEKILNLANNK